MQIFHAMKRADFCKKPQMVLQPNMILEVAQSKSTGCPDRSREEEDGEGSVTLVPVSNHR